jgi:hypothetical protein
VDAGCSTLIAFERGLLLDDMVWDMAWALVLASGFDSLGFSVAYIVEPAASFWAFIASIRAHVYTDG